MNELLSYRQAEALLKLIDAHGLTFMENHPEYQGRLKSATKKVEKTMQRMKERNTQTESEVKSCHPSSQKLQLNQGGRNSPANVPPVSVGEPLDLEPLKRLLAAATPEVSDELKVLADPQNVNRWYLATASDEIVIGLVDCIVGEAFAKGLVEAWNASLK